MFTQHLGGIRENGAIYSATDDGRVDFIDAEVIAAVAAAMLTQPDTPGGADPILTGPRILSYDDVAREMTEASGRPVVHVRLSVADLATHYEGYGLTPDYAATLAALDEGIATGGEDRLTDEVERWTKRIPTDFGSFLARHARMLQA